MNNVEPGDIVQDPSLGRGMVVYTETPESAVVAFPENPEMVVCPLQALQIKGNINSL